jgi:hypothetical protein
VKHLPLILIRDNFRRNREIFSPEQGGFRTVSGKVFSDFRAGDSPNDLWMGRPRPPRFLQSFGLSALDEGEGRLGATQ